MVFVSNLFIKTISKFTSKFYVSTKVVGKSENVYPLDGMGDHHRFML